MDFNNDKVYIHATIVITVVILGNNKINPSHFSQNYLSYFKTTAIVKLYKL